MRDGLPVVLEVIFSPSLPSERREGAIGGKKMTSHTSKKPSISLPPLSLPPLSFCTSSTLALVPIHPDLINEPFRKRDTGVRPDVFTSGPFFHFSCSKAALRCRTGLHLFRSHTRHKVKKKWKLESFLSVFDVYETYGLEMVYSYLHRTYHSKLSVRFPELLSAYLLGSLVSVNLELAKVLVMTEDSIKTSWMRILLIITTLLAEFTSRELRQPMLSSPLVPLSPTLSESIPIEILARIFNSKRISKKIAEQVTLQRASRPLRVGEIQSRAIYEPVYFDQERITWTLLQEDQAWILAYEQGMNQFSLFLDNATIAIVDEATSVLYSYRDYARLAHKGNILSTLENMLASQGDMSNGAVGRVPHEYQEHKLCSWIVLLAGELNDSELQEKITCSFTRDGLESIHSYLLDRVTEKLKSE